MRLLNKTETERSKSTKLKRFYHNIAATFHAEYPARQALG